VGMVSVAKWVYVIVAECVLQKTLSVRIRICGKSLWRSRAARVVGRFGSFVVLSGVLDSVAYAVGVCVGMSIFFAQVCHKGCISVLFGVMSLAILRCSVPAGRSNLELKVSMVVRSCISGLVLLPRCSSARISSVGCMW
jgi:hypothetical protein